MYSGLVDSSRDDPIGLDDVALLQSEPVGDSGETPLPPHCGEKWRGGFQ